MTEETNTYFVGLRLRRITHEDAYVSVPITEAITKPNEDGTHGLNVDAFLAEALRVSADPKVEWVVESRDTQPHPEQVARPADRQGFEADDVGKV